MGSAASMMGPGCSEGWPTGPAALKTQKRGVSRRLTTGGAICGPPVRAVGLTSASCPPCISAPTCSAPRAAIVWIERLPLLKGWGLELGLGKLSPTCLMTASTSQDP